MREFFHGWRRKVGCVALTFTLLLFVLWLRSLIKSESLTVAYGDRDHWITSSEGLVGWHSYPTDGFAAMMLSLPQQWRHTHDPNIEVVARWGHDFDVKWWRISHVAMMLPLTLLSAYLILWKPRPKERRDA
jgi:hypothetical protein